MSNFNFQRGDKEYNILRKILGTLRGENGDVVSFDATLPDGSLDFQGGDTDYRILRKILGALRGEDGRSIYPPSSGGGGDDTKHLIVAVSDEYIDLTTGTAKVTFRLPYALTLTEVRASVNTAPIGLPIQVDINLTGTGSILSSVLSIDAGTKTSEGSGSPPVISTASLPDDAEITIDIDQVGSTTKGKGLKVVLIGTT